MARIRTIKPEFFRHEALQDLESEYPGRYCMLVFAGLWTQCDSQGIFEYRPRQLKLDILPFLDFSMKETLNILESNGFLFSYTINEKDYGIIPSFPKHQRLTGKEASGEGARHPLPYCEIGGKQEGSKMETREQKSEGPLSQEKEKEREREKERSKEKRKKASPLLSDEEFIEALKSNPAYSHINFELEFHKMDAYLLTPKGRGKRKTQGFIVNWFNRIDRPVKISSNGGSSHAQSQPVHSAGVGKGAADFSDIEAGGSDI